MIYKCGLTCGELASCSKVSGTSSQMSTDCELKKKKKIKKKIW